MQLTPRYGDDAVMRVQSLFDDPATPLLRQHARLAGAVAGLDDEQWAAPSRCAGWSVQDVIAHLVSVNNFWTLSITSGLEGSPSRYLVSFDPVATPAQIVEGVRTWTPTETLERFRKSNDAMAATMAKVDGDSWSMPAEAPQGHIAIRLVAMHALWDSWVHERDVLLPLGLVPVEEADEIAVALAYVAGLGPAMDALGGSARPGALEIRATDPDVRVVVEVGPTVVIHGGPAPAGTVRITGNAVDLLESFSLRTSHQPELPERDRWLLGSLAEVFDFAG